jgi:YD repeat-containing protein
MRSWKGEERSIHFVNEGGERRRWKWNERGKNFRHDKK